MAGNAKESIQRCSSLHPRPCIRTYCPRPFGGVREKDSPERKRAAAKQAAPMVNGRCRQSDVGPTSVFSNDVSKIGDQQRLRMEQICEDDRSCPTEARKYIGTALPRR